MKYLVLMLVAVFVVGCNETIVNPANEVYDPNGALYSFLEVVEPNWVGDFGDSESVRLIYNVSKLRVITSLLSQRMLALEQSKEAPAPDDNRKSN